MGGSELDFSSLAGCHGEPNTMKKKRKEREGMRGGRRRPESFF
jgi:hypothetical protein